MRIVVLAGGISTERDVSLISGKQIYKALKENGHEVILVDVYLGYEMTEEESRLGVDALFKKETDWSLGITAIATDNPDIEKIKALRPDGEKYFFGPNVIDLCREADVVFMALHGENGENGKIQACFDLLGIQYTGTDYVSSAMAMNKGITKDIFKAHDIPTPFGMTMSHKEYEGKEYQNMEVPFPLIVKACCGGSSIGCAIASKREEFEEALKEAFKYDNEVVIEQFIKGREFTCCVMDGEALPIVEIAPKVGFYDYKNKYQAGSAEETCPANLSDELSDKIKRCSEKAFKALRLKNYARFDFLMDNETNDIYCLEANTLPGMTPTSLVPQEAAAVGISFGELCEKIISISIR